MQGRHGRPVQGRRDRAVPHPHLGRMDAKGGQGRRTHPADPRFAGRPGGTDGAGRPEGGRAVFRQPPQERERRPHDPQGRNRSALEGRPVRHHGLVGRGGRQRPLGPVGRRLRADVPQRRQRQRPGDPAAGRHHHPAVLPLRVRCGRYADQGRHHHVHRWGAGRQADQGLAGRQPDLAGRHRSVRRLAPGLGPQSAGALVLERPVRRRARAQSGQRARDRGQLPVLDRAEHPGRRHA